MTNLLNVYNNPPVNMLLQNVVKSVSKESLKGWFVIQLFDEI